MPADIASKNLAEGIWKALSLRVQTAALVTAAASTAAFTHLLPSEHSVTELKSDVKSQRRRGSFTRAFTIIPPWRKAPSLSHATLSLYRLRILH